MVVLGFRRGGVRGAEPPRLAAGVFTLSHGRVLALTVLINEVSFTSALDFRESGALPCSYLADYNLDHFYQ